MELCYCLQAIAFILGILAVCYSVVTTCVESRAMDLEAQQEDESELLPYRPDFFHAIFALASAYLCMLYISWNLNTLPGLHGDSKFQVLTKSLLGRQALGCKLAMCFKLSMMAFEDSETLLCACQASIHMPTRAGLYKM